MAGECVRLYQGKREKKTVFCSHAVEMAQKWEARGAKQLHLVDLDGAFAGQPENEEVIKEIRRQVRIPIQLGGGIRDSSQGRVYLEEGIDVIILGTMALRDPEGVKSLSVQYPGRIAVGIDCRQDRMAVEGWVEEGASSPVEVAQSMAQMGITRFIVTDITRDGTLTGPNLELLKKFCWDQEISLIASGGISTREHLIQLQELGGITGAIIGQALYTGDLTLEEIQGMGKGFL